MSDERRCEHCRHYRQAVGFIGGGGRVFKRFCALSRPLQPCSDYEREVGADDERGEHE